MRFLRSDKRVRSRGAKGRRRALVRRVAILKPRYTVKLSTMNDYPHADVVMAEVTGRWAHAWAENDGYIAGDSWETAKDMPHFAYAMPCNSTTLVDELRKEGYTLDLSEYSEPDFSEASKPCGMKGNCSFCYPED